LVELEEQLERISHVHKTLQRLLEGNRAALMPSLDELSRVIGAEKERI
jgi:hypothetical protein